MKKKQATEALLLIAEICEHAQIDIKDFEVVGVSKVGKQELKRIKDAMPTEREVEAIAVATQSAMLAAYYLLVAAEPDESLDSVAGATFQMTVSNLIDKRLGGYDVAMQRVMADE